VGPAAAFDAAFWWPSHFSLLALLPVLLLPKSTAHLTEDPFAFPRR
jgi:hypothetical protein